MLVDSILSLYKLFTVPVLAKWCYDFVQKIYILISYIMFCLGLCQNLCIAVFETHFVQSFFFFFFFVCLSVF